MSSIFEPAFQAVFNRSRVFTILFEDAEVDQTYLGLNEESTVLSISGAGCGIAGMLAAHPRRVDAVDRNRHHLALTALKVAAAREIESYDTFYDLLGRGKRADARAIVADIVGTQEPWVRDYWRRHVRMLERGLYRYGVFSRLFGILRRKTRTDAAWLRVMMRETPSERIADVDARFVPVLERRANALVVRSPWLLLAQGINFVQRDRNLRAEGTDDMLELVLRYLRRVAATDLERNWIAWHATAGEFNHDHPEAVPPYLRRENHARSFGAPTRVRFHARSIDELLAEAEPGTWSHIVLCDILDWMPDGAQRELLRACVRAARHDAILSYRSVERESIVARHELQRYFEPLDEATERATREDRSCLYRRVGFYRIRQ